MSGILWGRSAVQRRCFECSEPILPGAVYASYTEVFVTLNYTNGAELAGEKRTYCIPCAQLLADSITTTEEVA